MLSLQPRHLLLGCRILLPSLLSLLVLATSLFAQSETEPQSRVLFPSRPAYFHLPTGASLGLIFDVEACHDAEILIETSAPGEDIVVLTPSGQQLQTVFAEQPGWFVFWFPCTHPGRYQLLVGSSMVQHAISGTSVHIEYLPFSSSGADRRAQAAILFASAQSLAGSPHATRLRSAIEEYREAAAAWAGASDREDSVLALSGEARAWLNLSEYGNALAVLNRARLVSSHMPFFRAELANLESEVHLDRWESDLAMRFAQEGLSLSRGLADPWLAAGALAGRAEAEFLSDNPTDQADLEQALVLSRESDAGETMARALRCKAWIESDEGRITRAMTLMRQVEEQFQADGEVRNALDAMANMATIQGMHGDHYAALISHSSLISPIRDSGKQTDLAFLLLNTAKDYMQLNRVPDALTYYREAVETFRKVGLLSGESIGRSQLCMAEERAGQLHRALLDCWKAKVVTERLHDPKRIALTIWRVGVVQSALGNTAQAIDSFQQAYSISDRVHDPHSQAQSLMDWGDTLERQGNREQAGEKFVRALPLSQKAEDIPEEIEVRFRIARSEFEAGEDEKAKSDLNLALTTIDVQRRAVRNPELQASYFAQLHKCHELYIELLMREHERDPSSDLAAQALEVSESGRALTLLDTLSIRSRTSAVPQPGRTRELFGEQLAVERAYHDRLKLMLEGAKKRELEANEAVLTQAVDTLERAEDELRSQSASGVLAGTPLKASEIADASRKLNTTLVEYALGADHSYVWVIDHGNIESHMLPARTIIESAVKEWRALATARIPLPGAAFDEARKHLKMADVELPRLSARLSCMLLAPFLRPHMDRLAIVPDGELDLLPFAALPEDGCHGGSKPVAAGRQTVFVPSLSIFLLPRQTPGYESWRGEIALLADPVFDADDPRVHRTAGSYGPEKSGGFGLALPRLFGSREEATAIASLVGPDRSAVYLGFNASLQTLLDPSLSQYRILHLATHGVLDESSPGFSGIVLSLVNREGQPVFGYLKQHDVENLNLHFNLVVLSSCDSGSGSNLSGEGVTGLNYAFLSAGATRVLSTLWSVDDETSKDLMVAFYSAMFHDGLDPAEALRRSQMKLMQNPTTSAPYYWAGFTITTIAI